MSYLDWFLCARNIYTQKKNYIRVLLPCLDLEMAALEALVLLLGGISNRSNEYEILRKMEASSSLL